MRAKFVLPWLALSATACLAQGVAAPAVSLPTIAWGHECVRAEILLGDSAPPQPTVAITLVAGCDTRFGLGGGPLPSFAFRLRFRFLFVPEGGPAAPRELQANLVSDYLPPWTEDEERRELEYRLSGLTAPGRGRLRVEAHLGASTLAEFALDLPGILKIRVLDGRNGKPIAGAFITARVWRKGPKFQLRTSPDGVAYLALPVSRERAVSMRIRGFTDCRTKRTAREKFPFAAIFRYGLVAENRCGSAAVQPAPGELVLFAEPRR